MCRPVTCKICSKTTWAGCGQHISTVKASVPSEQWCDGKHSADEKSASASKGFFSKIFGR